MKLRNSRSFSGSWALEPGVQRPPSPQAHRAPPSSKPRFLLRKRGEAVSAYLPCCAMASFSPCQALPGHTPTELSCPASASVSPTPSGSPVLPASPAHLRLHPHPLPSSCFPPWSILTSLGGAQAPLTGAFPVLNNYCLKADPEACTPSLCLSFPHLRPPPPTHNAGFIFPIF